MKKRAETCVKVVYKILPKPRNPSEIKGSERTYAKTLDFTGFPLCLVSNLRFFWYVSILLQL